jgi:DNA helicase-2/ATP-dependent DNA helicase PcrA
LIATTSRWRDGTKAVEPSEIYEFVTLEVSRNDGIVLADTPHPEDGAINPSSENPLTGIWPRDPLGSRRGAFDTGIELVRNSTEHSLTPESDEEIQSWVRDAGALVAEFHQGRVKPQVFLPSRLSVSTLVALRENPAELALSIRRPMPRSQDEYSRRGTLFHVWIEKHFGQGTLFDDEDLEPVDPLEEDQSLAKLKECWLESSFADRQPFAVEVPFETVISGVLLRGRIDAVYKIGDRYEVIDWKTGSKKLGEPAAIQLAVYRLAWAKLKAIDLSQVSAAFHYVPTGITDRRADLLDEDGLVALLDAY